MTNEFAKKVEKWNRRYKSRHDCQAERESGANNYQTGDFFTDADLAQSKQTFSRQVYEWNKHYRVRKSESNASEDSVKLKEKAITDEGDTFEVDINEKVTEWDQHYKSIGRLPTNSQSQNSYCEEVNAMLEEREDNLELTDRVNKWELYYHPVRDYQREDNKQQHTREEHLELTDKVNMWELYYHSTGRHKRDDKKQASSCKRSRTLSAADHRMSDLVDRWNKHYTVSRHRSSPNDEQSQYYRKSRLNRVTSLLVKHWDDHYIAITKDAKSTKHSEPLSPKTLDKENSGEKKSPSGAKLSRTPSLVRARVERFATQAGNASNQQHCKPQQQDSMIISRRLSRGNIAELKSKFSIAC